jgi:hypothetical protein
VLVDVVLDVVDALVREAAKRGPSEAADSSLTCRTDLRGFPGTVGRQGKATV